LAKLPAAQRIEILDEFPPEVLMQLEHDWHFWARPHQLPPPGQWSIWLLLAGRGFGKTRSGAEWVNEKAAEAPIRIALIGETAADCRDVLVEGESGILACARPEFKPEYQSSVRRVTWPNGSTATTYSGDAPDQLRGPQHHFAWADECAKWKYAQDAWDMMAFGLRLGTEPQVMATTTPRPIPLIKQLVAQSKQPNSGVVLTVGDTYENIPNLATGFIRHVIQRYEGTRLGRQELHAHILEDVPGALWTRDILEACRVVHAPEMKRVVVGVDPAAGAINETGVVVAGLGINGHGYILADGSLSGLPDVWGRRVISLHQDWQSDCIVPEVNNGGEMVRYTLQTIDRNAPITPVRAIKNKQARAEPVAALYEQCRIHHVGLFAALEDEYCNWVPGEGMPSPNRLDAAVWALTSLMVKSPQRWLPVGE